jgi:hypothetical protein
MPGNAKALKRNNRECKEILIGPSMAPHFSGAEIPFSLPLDEQWRRLPVKSRGTDGKPTTTLFDRLELIPGAAGMCFCTARYISDLHICFDSYSKTIIACSPRASIVES